MYVTCTYLFSNNYCCLIKHHYAFIMSNVKYRVMTIKKTCVGS